MTAVMAMAALTGWSQEILVNVPDSVERVRVIVTGKAPEEVTKVFIFGGSLYKHELLDSVTVERGQWVWQSDQPWNEFIGVMAGSTDNEQGMVSFFADSTEVAVDLVAGTVVGSRQSESLNGTLRGLLRIMKDDREGRLPKDADSKMLALMMMRDSVMSNKDNMVPSIFLPMIAGGMHYTDLKALADNTTAPYASHPCMETVALQLAHLEEGLAKRPLGTMLTDLTMADGEGTEHALSEWCGKGKYVLVDFWASWCGPCLRELPNVIECYEKYRERGLEIIGISLDNNKEAWLAAVKRLEMAWPQLSDLKGWKSLGATTYGIQSIPANILVDPEGRIVDNDLRGVFLRKRLEELLER